MAGLIDSHLFLHDALPMCQALFLALGNKEVNTTDPNPSLHSKDKDRKQISKH